MIRGALESLSAPFIADSNKSAYWFVVVRIP